MESLKSIVYKKLSSLPKFYKLEEDPYYKDLLAKCFEEIKKQENHIFL